MNSKKHRIVLALAAFTILSAILFSPEKTISQPIQGSIESSAGYTNPDRMPFWLRANRFGDVPLDAASVGILGRVEKPYQSINKPLFDWGVAFEGRVFQGEKTELLLIEGYAKARLWIFQLKAGRSKDMMGLTDSVLSTGSFSVSGTALGVPKIEGSVPEFYTLPFLWDLFAFKGNLVHGWLGEVPMRNDGVIFPVNTFLHQKSFYGRMGNDHWRLKVYGGFNHQVQWGNEAYYYGDDGYTLTDAETFWYVLIGKAYGTPNIPRSKVGNHLGSIDLGLEYEFENVRMLVYRQNFFEVGALYYLANIRDGLQGVSFINLNENSMGFSWQRILLEFFHSKNQAGEIWSPFTPSGDENYYNNFQYVEGWSYNNLNLGNPLIGTRQFIRALHPTAPRNHFVNNRVVAFHTGFQAQYNLWDFTVLATYSLNYGTFGTSEAGHSLGNRREPPRYGIFEETAQFSGSLFVSRKLGGQMSVGIRTAFDYGDLYYNSVGAMVFFERKF